MEQTSNWAIASLATTILGFFTGGVTFILAIIFGHLALAEIKRNSILKGKELAKASLIVSYIAIGLAIVGACLIIGYYVISLTLQSR
jgi:uncharacterized membrane protein YwzB